MALQDVLNFYKALSDETRLKILKMLEKGELCVCDIVYALNTVQPKISFHLSILKQAGIIVDRKEGKWSYYSLKEDDLFKRFIFLSTIEKISEEDMKEELMRLRSFLKQKEEKKLRNACTW